MILQFRIDLDNVPFTGKDDDSTGGAKRFRATFNNLVADSIQANGLIYSKALSFQRM